MTDYAEAKPTKRFFIEMLTADISLEDALLDLIDNSIDALIRSRSLPLSVELLANQPSGSEPASITVVVGTDSVVISDNCGGIPIEEAREHVFRIGRVRDSEKGGIGVYGIGLKRAIFKIGNRFEMTSKTIEGGFRASLNDINEWSKDDDNWHIPLSERKGATNPIESGTTLTISQFTPETVGRVRDGRLLESLDNAIATTYPLFLGKYVTISLNGRPVEPVRFPLAASADITPALERRILKSNGKGDVAVTMIASIASKSAEKRWTAESAGWYVVCNGRVVVSADKTRLTGWGDKQTLPQFQPKYRPFLGLAFFTADNPSALPWTTTKRGLNRDSPVFRQAEPLFGLVGRPVLTFLNKWYPSESSESPAEREVATSAKSVSLQDTLKRKDGAFKADVKSSTDRGTTKIQFDVTKGELGRARRCFGDSKLSGVKVGRQAFEYFLENECPE